MEVMVIINENHSIIQEQHEILEREFHNYKTLTVPACGWTLEEQKEMVSKLLGKTVVFISPVPFLLSKLAFVSGYGHEDNCIAANAPLKGHGTQVLTFHNDKREKKELPNGKIISVVAQTGWQLVRI